EFRRVLFRSTGGATIAATTLRLDSNGTVTLTNANNVGTLAANINGNLSFTNNAALIIGTASGRNGVNVGSNTLTISANGAITQTQPVTAGTASFTSTLAAAQINLGNGSNSISGPITFAPTGAGNVTLFNNNATNLAASTIGGTLTVTSTGDISDSGAVNVSGAASFETRNNAAASITLDQSTFGSLTARIRNALNSANSSGNINIIEAGQMDVTAIDSGSGSVTLESDKIVLGGANTVESDNGGTITLEPIT